MDKWRRYRRRKIRMMLAMARPIFVLEPSDLVSEWM